MNPWIKTLRTKFTGKSATSGTVPRILNFARDRAILGRTDHFDRGFYLSQNEDVAASKIDPVKHYLVHGAFEGRNPNSNFDSAAYLRKYPDVAAAGLNPLVHYIRFGEAEGRTAAPDAARVPDGRGCPPEITKAARSAKQPVGNTRQSDRKKVADSGLFDATYYLDTYKDIAAGKIDPLDHFIDHGWREGRRPNPNFDLEWYADQCPDVLKAGINPVVHYIDHGKAGGFESGPNPVIFEAARRMIAEAGAIEPGILLDNKLLEPESLYINHSNRGSPVLRAWQKLFASLERPFDYVVAIPWLVKGGADLAACNAVRAAIEKHGQHSTLLLLTDHDRREAEYWLPAGTNIRVISDYDKALSRSDRAKIVEMLITAMRPKAVLNVNSGALWEATAKKGNALSSATDIYAYLFCRDYLPDGRAAGYSDSHFREALPYLKRVYFDNTAFRNELVDQYGAPPSLQTKMTTLRQPMSTEADRDHQGGPAKRDAVVWAGRFCEQKNVDLLIEIAKQAHEFSFDVFGYGDDAWTGKLEAAAATLSNLRLMGPFSSTSNLPLEDYNAFLFTSLWEGLPLTLADIALTGIPIVASSVGGVPELVTDETGWCVSNYRSAEGYIRALEEIKTQPSSATKKGIAMRAHVRDTHSWSQFYSAICESPSFLD
jgi:glycosyltransferase involved in cell wall biosynthesis